MITAHSYRQMLFILARLFLCLALSVTAARYLNSRNYSDSIGRALVKIHAEPRFSLDAGQLAKYLLEGDPRLQELLDRNAAIYALVITDCKEVTGACSEQKILQATNPALIRNRVFRPADLVRYPYVVLRRPSSSILDILEHQEKGGGSGRGTVIGRVYSISTIPSFSEDYRSWMKDPFRSDGLWQRYLATMAACLAGGVGFWLLMELFLKIRRIERKNARQREQDLTRNADIFLRQYEEKQQQLEEQEQRSRAQYEAYIARIREMERKQRSIDDYRRYAETMIRELEEEKTRQSLVFKEELERVGKQRQALHDEVEKYRKDPRKGRPGASTDLEIAINPRFANSFEKKVFSAIAGSPRCRSGEWNAVTNFDVAIGKGGSQFVDCLVISRDCLVVVEAKNYSGKIVPEGDLENSTWLCQGEDGLTVAVKGAWGVNPYHQVREYTMSLMNLIKRGRWKLSAYGVIVFPEGTDISPLGDTIGRFYRITTADRLVGLIGNLDAAARRENAFTKRPTPDEIENLIRGI